MSDEYKTLFSLLTTGIDGHPNKLNEIKSALRNGANPNKIHWDYGVSAMHLAAGQGDLTTEILLYFGGDPNICSSENITPLHIAAGWGHTKTIELLLQWGADMTIQDQDGKTAYDLAVQEGHKECTSLLKNHMVNLVLKDSISTGTTSHFGDGITEDGHDLNASFSEDEQQYFLSSTNQFKEKADTSSRYSSTITRKLYEYLKEGQQVVFDATSPNTPLLGLRSSSLAQVQNNSNTYTPSPTSKPIHKLEQLEIHPGRQFSEKSDNGKLYVGPQDISNPCNLTLSTTAMHDKMHGSSQISESCTVVHTELPRKQTDLCVLQNKYIGSSLDRIKPSSSFVSSSTSSISTQNSFSAPFTNSEKSTNHIRNNKHSSPCSSKDKLNLKGAKLSQEFFNDSDHTKDTVKNNGQSTLSSQNNMLCNSLIQTQKFVKPKNVALNSFNSTVLPKSYASPQNRVAEFILSSANFMEKCKITDCSDNKLSAVCRPTLSEQSLKQEPSSLNCSNSSCNTFTTCDEGFDELYSCKNKSYDLKENGKIQTPVSRLSPVIKIKEPKSIYGEDDLTLQSCVLKWKSPHGVLPAEEDLMTSDDSFFQRSLAPRVYKTKLKTKDKLLERLESPSYMNISKEHSFKPSHILQHESSKTSQVPIRKKRVSDVSLMSTLSVIEYLYEDEISGITFIERHLPSEGSISNDNDTRRSLESTVSGSTLDSEATDIYKWSSFNKASSTSSKVTRAPFSLDTKSFSEDFNKNPITNDHLRDKAEECNLQSLQNLTIKDITQRLNKYGEICGPITSSTRQVYLRRLASLESNPGMIGLSKKVPDYPLEMCEALCGKFESRNIEDLEVELVESFNANGCQWREGSEKSSFTYLLLDPRITRNLPLRAKELSALGVFKTFIHAIFYIGKGKRSRPYSHLYEACTKMKRESRKTSAKVQHILDIWNAGFGVVSLHCFQSVIPAEAYTREACMLEAIGLHKVTNLKKGDFYGTASTWSPQQRRRVGVYLLQKALQIFLAEGERQICVPDLKS